MSSKTAFYLGLLLIIVPFLGIYSFMKTGVYIAVGLWLIYISKKHTRKSETK